MFFVFFGGSAVVFKKLLSLGPYGKATQNKNVGKLRPVASKVMVLAEKQGKHAAAVLAGPLRASVCQRASPSPGRLELPSAAVEVFKLGRATWPFSFFQKPGSRESRHATPGCRHRNGRCACQAKLPHLKNLCSVARCFSTSPLPVSRGFWNFPVCRMRTATPTFLPKQLIGIQPTKTSAED